MNKTALKEPLLTISPSFNYDINALKEELKDSLDIQQVTSSLDEFLDDEHPFKEQFTEYVKQLKELVFETGNKSLKKSVAAVTRKEKIIAKQITATDDRIRLLQQHSQQELDKYEQQAHVFEEKSNELKTVEVRLSCAQKALSQRYDAELDVLVKQTTAKYNLLQKEWTALDHSMHTLTKSKDKLAEDIASEMTNKGLYEVGLLYLNTYKNKLKHEFEKSKSLSTTKGFATLRSASEKAQQTLNNILDETNKQAKTYNRIIADKPSINDMLDQYYAKERVDPKF